MARPLALVPLAMLCAGGLVGCAIYLDTGSRDRGPTVTQDRAVSDVAVLDFAASGDVTLSVGEPSLTITGGENVLDDLTVEVRGDTLVVDLDDSWHSPGRITYDLALPHLASVRLTGSGTVAGEVSDEATGSRELTLSGSGHIDLGGLAADDLTVSVDGSGEVDVARVAARRTAVEIAGSGQVHLSGESDELSARIPGSGQIAAGGVTAQDVVAVVGGSGSIEVRAEDTLDASVDGSGSIVYRGDATVTRSITGSGQISPR